MENSQMIMKKPQIIAIDFDGTMVEHDFPRIGEPVPFAINVCKRLMRAGHKIMLWTMRSDNHESWSKPEKQQPFENVLYQATQYMQDNGIELWGINQNPEQNWSSSNKQYANLYIDDAALGCPLVTELWDNEGNKTKLDKPYVNWWVVDRLLQFQGYYQQTSYQVSKPNNTREQKAISYLNERTDAIDYLMNVLKLHYEDVFLAKEHSISANNEELPTIVTASWYKGAGLYVDFELIVPQELLDDEDTDIIFKIDTKEFSITCHN